MKLTKSLLIVTLACGTMWAQAPANHATHPPAKTPAPAAPVQAKKPAPVKPASTVASPAAPKPAPTASSAVKPLAAAKPAAKPVPAVKPAITPAAHVAAKPPVAQKAPTPKTPVKAIPVKAAPVKAAPVVAKKPGTPVVAEKPASVKEQATATRVGRMRDPFVSPIVRSTGRVGSGCDTGKRCLMVDEIVLKGIVKSPSGFIAVVENPAKRAYFMRENDPVFNGKITRITGDTVVFEEQIMDKLGKQGTREVVKKVNAPVV
ncbi:MAG TPA: hypothetical protein VG897_02420 [Terriglobales bacterium]|nr:hypothetical protein [Terriglobales bacterium]